MQREEIRELLTATELDVLLSRADQVRRSCVGDVIHIRALLEFSNQCFRNCKYCGLNVGNENIKRYSMSYDEIITVAKTAFEVGYKTIVLQSGESHDFDICILRDIVSEISSWGMIVTLSCGELSDSEYALLKSSGASKYLLKHECANTDMYSHLHDGYLLEDRLKSARVIKCLGYEYGGGFLVGLPDEDIELVIDNLLLIQKLACDMVGVGTFIAHPDTILKGEKSGDYELTLRCIAIVRLMLPYSNIPATTSLSILGDSDRIFSAGANVVMVKVTPQAERECYEIYPSNAHTTDIEKDRVNMQFKINKLGRQSS